jgi:hypothetical protein
VLPHLVSHIPAAEPSFRAESFSLSISERASSTTRDVSGEVSDEPGLDSRGTGDGMFGSFIFSSDLVHGH